MKTAKIIRRRRKVSVLFTAVLILALSITAICVLSQQQSPIFGQMRSVLAMALNGADEPSPLHSKKDVKTPKPGSGEAVAKELENSEISGGTADDGGAVGLKEMSYPAVRGDYLILVNADNPIPSETPDFEIVPAYGVLPLLTSDINIEHNTLDALVLLFEDAGKAGIDNLLVNAGFRSHEAQQRIYDETEDKTLVQRPGCSEHQTGLAVDIAAKGVQGSVMGDSTEGKWLAKNAWKYGFILRYPENKRDVTGIAYEPWHFRYVGPENAKNMYDNDLCLEEYLRELDR